MERSCPSCGTLCNEAARECPKCAKPLAIDPAQTLVQSIVEKNRKAAKAEQEKATVLGVVIASMAYQVIVKFFVHYPPTEGINFYRLGGAVAFAVAGAAMGRWIGAPAAKK